jgi:hypothetical protein
VLRKETREGQLRALHFSLGRQDDKGGARELMLSTYKHLSKIQTQPVERTTRSDQQGQTQHKGVRTNCLSLLSLLRSMRFRQLGEMVSAFSSAVGNVLLQMLAPTSMPAAFDDKL